MRGVERIAPVAAPRSHDTNRGLVVLERADLDRRGMCAQEDVPAKIEAVLRVERRMILGKIEGVEVVALGLRLGTDGAREPQLAEDVADLVNDLRDNVEPTAPLRAAGHGAIDARRRGAAALQLELSRLDGALQLALQRVRGPTHALARLGIEPGKGLQNLGESAGFATQKLDLELLEPAPVGLRNLLQTLPQRLEGCKEVAQGQRAFLATSARCSNAAGSRTARSARIFRLISTPALRRPFISRLYESACSRAAALMRVIQSRRNSTFLLRRSRYAYRAARSVASLAAFHSLLRPPQYPLASFITLFLRFKRATLLLTRGIGCSLRQQQALEAAVGVRDERGLAQLALPLRMLRGQDVALVRPVPAQLPGAREPDAFSQGALGFHLRHR